ncbi:MAG TPA: hypothetical protein VN207_02440 [Ktedonobacteraceae bacterium]|nr:hypothetical protein [Ktedonobacteraceae bacterium]
MLSANGEEAKKGKQRAKKELLIKVMKWIGEDISRAKREFESSAQEVIDKLRNIESKLLGVITEDSQHSMPRTIV